MKCPGCGNSSVLHLGKNAYCAFCFRSGASYAVQNPEFRKLVKEFDDLLNAEVQ
jgi:hypothetical protein